MGVRVRVLGYVFPRGIVVNEPCGVHVIARVYVCACACVLCLCVCACVCGPRLWYARSFARDSLRYEPLHGSLHVYYSDLSPADQRFADLNRPGELPR